MALQVRLLQAQVRLLLVLMLLKVDTSFRVEGPSMALDGPRWALSVLVNSCNDHNIMPEGPRWALSVLAWALRI